MYFAPMKKTPSVPRMSRKAILETLEHTPIERVLLGAPSAGTLTPKQRAFAQAVALGDTKAGAYRKAYDTAAGPVTVGHTAHRLTTQPKIAAQIEAFKVAAEARKYATPAALRSLVVERLTATAIDSDIPPAQRLRALELLGKVTEVAAFTERREVVTVTDSGALRERLLETLRNAITTDAAVLARVRAAASTDAVVSDILSGADGAQAGEAEAGSSTQAASALEGHEGAAGGERGGGDPTHPPPPEVAEGMATPTT